MSGLYKLKKGERIAKDSNGVTYIEPIEQNSPMPNKIIEDKKYSVDEFISKFMNDHNGYPPRWLRGIFFSEQEKIETILEYMTGIEKSAKKEAVEECIKKIDDYGDKLVREGAEEQSDYYMGELNVVSRIKEILFAPADKKSK